MRRLIAAGILTVIIVGLFITSRLTIEHYYESIENKISDCRQSYLDGNESSAAEKAAELEKDWEKAERIMAIFVNHEVLDEIGASVVKLAPLAENKNESAFHSECELSLMLLEHMRESEQFSLFSIF